MNLVFSLYTFTMHVPVKNHRINSFMGFTLSLWFTHSLILIVIYQCGPLVYTFYIWVSYSTLVLFYLSKPGGSQSRITVVDKSCMWAVVQMGRDVLIPSNVLWGWMSKPMGRRVLSNLRIIWYWLPKLHYFTMGPFMSCNIWLTLILRIMIFWIHCT